MLAWMVLLLLCFLRSSQVPIPCLDLLAFRSRVLWTRFDSIQRIASVMNRREAAEPCSISSLLGHALACSPARPSSAVCLILQL